MDSLDEEINLEDKYPTEPFPISKIFITGPLVPTMPYIVLRELALEAGILVSMERLKDPIYYAKVFAKIAKFKPPLLSNIEDKIDMEKAVHFVNPLSDWDLESIKKATHFLHKFYDLYQSENKNIFPFYQPGLQTPNILYVLNACVLYAYCRLQNILLPIDINYEGLKEKVLNCFPSPIKIKSVEIYSEDDESDEDGYKFDFFKNYDEVRVVGELFQDIGYLQNNFYPITDPQSIVAGAVVYLTDLSVFSKPLDEFKQIRKGLNFKNKTWNKYQSKNGNLLDLNLYFNPFFPETFYLKETLDHHMNLFSYSSQDFIGLTQYEILQELFIKDNFHIGWHPNIISYESPIFLDEIEEIKSEEILSYGSIHEKSLLFTTWRELNDLFHKMNSFVNPFEINSILDNNKIQRLIKLGEFILHPQYDYKYLFDHFQTQTKIEIKKCLETIKELLFQQKVQADGFLGYRDAYNKSSNEEQLLFQKSLDHLFLVCMYMRGWSGKKEHDYPIERVPFSDNNLTEKNTIESIFELDEINQKTLGVFYDFPLMIWKNEFIKSSLEDQGLTIGERIKMVKNGENSNISSCIRMTSNVLGSSYCFYCKLFGIEPKFDIQNLRHIQ
jgi:hypothetical protein